MVFLAVLALFYFRNINTPKENNENEEEKEIVIPKDQLLNQLSIWSMDIYTNKSYDKCVDQGDGSCFISLTSLEKDYGKDISLFRKKGAECTLSLSGLSFYLNNKNIPFSMVLGGCKYNNPSTDE